MTTAVVLIVVNARGRTSGRSALGAWCATVVYIGFVGIVVSVGAASVDEAHGYGVLAAMLVALPMSVPGAMLHQTLAASFHVAADPAMSVVFAASSLCWALLNPLVARRIRQAVRRRRAGSRSDTPVASRA